MSAPATTDCNVPRKSRDEASIRYSALSAHALSFLLGILVTLLTRNFFSGDSATFSTPSLISFLFGIALSAASTVLAVAAISLGKASEHAMIERSDASIRLQNEVFTKTTEALARIESSTGVTEKRIEDIISGRAGELSHAIAERLGSSTATKGRTREALEQEIRESLVSQLSATSAAQNHAAVEARKREQEAEKHYRRFQNALLVAVASSQAGIVEKVGEGHFGTEGADLFDAVLKIGEKRVGISAFGRSHANSFPSFVEAVTREIASGRFQHALIALDREAKHESKFQTSLRNALLPVKEEIAKAIEFFHSPDGGAVAPLTQRLKELAGTSQATSVGTSSNGGAAPGSSDGVKAAS